MISHIETAHTSVIIPCHDDAATLEETVASVLREPDGVDLVVVDDGSTDEATVALLAKLESDDVRVIRQQNRGPSAAVMAGVHATSTPYVMRLDADDLLEPGAVAALSGALDAAPDAALAWGDLETFGATSFRVPSAPTLDPWLITFVNGVTYGLLRRTTLEESGGFRLRDGFEDWDLWMSLAERGYRGIYVPRVTFRYRRDGGGRFTADLARTEAHYAQLRRLHQDLFARQNDNRRRSPAPRSLKLAVRAVDALPGLSRLAKIQLCQLLTLLFWNGGLRATATMVKQAVALRLASRRVI